MSKHGELTAEIGKSLKFEGYDVYYDHGTSGDNVGKIVSWFGEKYRRKAELCQLDIAVVEQNSERNVSALVEIEETNHKPKTLLGDVFATLLGEHFKFQGKHDLKVGAWTTLILMGKGNGSAADKVRIEFLKTNVNKNRSSQSKENMSVGEVVIELFNNESDLENILKLQIELACKREKQILAG